MFVRAMWITELCTAVCDGKFTYSFQSDVIHQCALEFIHSEDRDTFKSQLDWKHQLTTAEGAEASGEMTLDQIFQPGKNNTSDRTREIY